jgi:tetratricopeptide (TPR) repeat protein
MRWNKFSDSALLMLVLIIGLPAVAFAGDSPTEKLPVNVKMMNTVWEAYNKKQYQEAIARANELIDEFGNDASEKQRELTAENADAPPPKGKVGKSEKEKIFALGPLHEVAAAWWVKGRCFEKEGKRERALEAYKKASEYTHARVYDPSWDGFWAPSEKARQRIEDLQQSKN